MISLRALEFEIDFETFCNLRIRAPSDFDDYDYAYPFFADQWNNAMMMHSIMMQQQENIMRGNPDVGAPPGEERMIPDDNSVDEDDDSPPAFFETDLEFIAENNVRVALEHEEENTCYVCLENFANITFDGCMKADVCCYLCAYHIMYTTKKCPHCRTSFSSFWEKPLDPTDAAWKGRRVRRY